MSRRCVSVEDLNFFDVVGIITVPPDVQCLPKDCPCHGVLGPLSRAEMLCANGRRDKEGGHSGS